MDERGEGRRVDVDEDECVGMICGRRSGRDRETKRGAATGTRRGRMRRRRRGRDDGRCSGRGEDVEGEEEIDESETMNVVSIDEEERRKRVS